MGLPFGGAPTTIKSASEASEEKGMLGGVGGGAVDRQQLEGAHNTPPQMLVAEEDERKASKVQTNRETMSGRKSHCPVCVACTDENRSLNQSFLGTVPRHTSIP